MTASPQPIEDTASSSSPDLEVVMVPVQGIDQVESLAREMLAPAFERTQKIDIEDVLDACRYDTMQLWFLCEKDAGRRAIGCIVTELIYLPQRKVARVIAAAGKDAMRWKPCIGKFEEWARAEGCAALELVGRKGWGRIQPEYQEIERVYSKELGQ
jgi:hypothetical protein